MIVQSIEMPPVRCTFILSPRRRLIRIGLAHEAILLSSSSSVFLLLESLELSARATTQNLPLRGFLCDWDRNDLGYNGFSTLGVRRLLCSTSIRFEHNKLVATLLTFILHCVGLGPFFCFCNSKESR